MSEIFFAGRCGKEEEEMSQITQTGLKTYSRLPLLGQSLLILQPGYSKRWWIAEPKTQRSRRSSSIVNRITLTVNLRFEGASTQPLNSDVLVDIKKNGQSLINGPQVLLAIRPILLEASYTITTVDSTDPAVPKSRSRSKECPTYEVTLTNNTTDRELVVDFVTLVAEPIRRADLALVQNYPPRGQVALTLPPTEQNTLEVSLEAETSTRSKSKSRAKRCSTPVSVTVSANIIWPIAGVELFFDVLRDGVSLMNGPRVMLQALTGGSMDLQEVNFTFSTVDSLPQRNHPSTAPSVYQLVFFNRSTTLPLAIDFYTFSAQRTPKPNLTNLQLFAPVSLLKHPSPLLSENPPALPLRNPPTLLSENLTALTRADPPSLDLPGLTSVMFRLEGLGCPSGQTAVVLVNAFISFFFEDGAQHQILFNLQRIHCDRNGEKHVMSLSNGFQVLSLRSLLNAPPDLQLDVIRTISIVDPFCIEKNTTYELVLYNGTVEPVRINFITMQARV